MLQHLLCAACLCCGLSGKSPEADGCCGEALPPVSEYRSVTSLFSIAGKWETDTGQTFNLDHWSGRPLAIAMIYADCHMTCPATIETLCYLERRAGQKCRFLIVTLDPRSDSMEMLHELRQRAQLSENIDLVRGTPAMTYQLARTIKIAYRNDAAGLAHQSAIVVVDARGKICGRFSGSRPEFDKFQQALSDAR